MKMKILGYEIKKIKKQSRLEILESQMLELAVAHLKLAEMVEKFGDK